MPVALPNNPALAAHLARIAAQGRASDDEVAEIERLAGKASWAEANAIRETMRGIDTVSPEASRRIDDYLWREMELRHDHVERSKKISDAIGAATLATTVVAVPVLNHFLAIGGLDAATNAAANAVQLAILAGEYLGGFAAARAIAHRFKGSDYGDQD